METDLKSVQRRLTAALIVIIAGTGTRSFGQELVNHKLLAAAVDRQVQQGTSANPDYEPASASPPVFLRNLARDQKAIWTAPFKARIQDLNWIAPMVGLTAGLINADAELSSRIDTTGTFSKHGSTIANAGVAAMVGGAGGMYLLGKLKHDNHETETAILAGEAVVNGVIVTEVLKAITRRERPKDGAGQGLFWKNGSLLNSSFPSDHSIVAWSAASVLAHEYPGWGTQTLGYGLATIISMARVYGKDHFTSDVFVSAAMGWMIGRQIYASHHNPDLPGGGYGTFHPPVNPEAGPSESTFSAYVPLDSWVYPAMERLAALGYIKSNLSGMKPWTRVECARQLEEASGSIDELSGDEGARLYTALSVEFKRELTGETGPYAQIDSVYARVMGISGPPLIDDYHFGRTIVNDFGRPFGEGTNTLGGFSASGSAGALGFYIDGEFEHAPFIPAVPQSVQDAIQVADLKPPAPAFSTPEFNQFRLLDTYVAWNFRGWQTSFGKQSLSLGPVEDPFLQSMNAEPMYTFRVDQTVAKQLPWILKYMGPYRIEFWASKLTGQHFVFTQDSGQFAVALGRTLPKQPMNNGVKFNFKPTQYVEFGIGRTGLFGGPDFPITLGSLRHSLFSTANAVGRGNDPGDRRSSFDFSYRIPGARDWLTVYEDSMVEDEISPIGYPRRAAHDAGLYMSRVPGLRHLDMRVEGAYTNLPGLLQPPGGGFFYWNVRYLDGYTNKGHIIGNGTVGRQGIALRAESTYWFASDKTIQLGYRSNIADDFFLQGGNVRDAFARSDWRLAKDLSLKSLLQYEWWNFPLLSAGNKQTNFTASFQFTYWPHWRLKGGS